VPAEIIDPLNGGLRVLREIQAPQHVQPAPDKPSGVRISSAAFGPGTDGSVSIDLEESLQKAKLPLTARYPSMPRAVGAVACTVDEIRAQKLAVMHKPIPADEELGTKVNDHHGEIRDEAKALSRKARRDAARALADKCEIVVPFDVEAVKRYADGRG
jgi:hypothetical protein